MSTLLKKILPAGGAILVLSVLFYVCYLPWETHTIFGDDLINITLNMKAQNFVDKLNSLEVFQKFRPLHDFWVTTIIYQFQKNLHYYYIFNVAMLSIACYIFSRVVNLVLQSQLLSLFAGAVLGLSHIFYYHITHILLGGTLETQALIYFFAMLYFLLRVLLPDKTPENSRNLLLWAILFANLALYTHERYVVVFLALLLVIWLPSVRRHFTYSSSIIISLLTLFSPILNALIKTQVLKMPYMVGTASSNIEFSFSQIIEFLFQTTLSIIQINHGPDYLVGITFWGLPGQYKILAASISLFFLFMAAIVIRETAIAVFRKLASRVLEPSALRPSTNTYIKPMFVLLTLLLLCLVPAISTIRVEQRWITAPYAIFLILVLIVLRNHIRGISKQNAMIVTFFVLLISTNRVYSELGNQNLYMYNSHTINSRFYNSYISGVVHPSTERLIFLLKTRNENYENEVRWSSLNGQIYEFYFGKAKKLSFTDGKFSTNDSGKVVPPIPDFNAATDQVILLTPDFKDVTADYVRDTLKILVTEMNKQ
jgi:hypothetical protein